MTVVHPFPPVFDRFSRVLVLGTIPSPQSRENGFYYGHPQNRFWRVLAGLFSCPPPATVAEKTSLVLTNHIALWDVCAACEIDNAADASIRAPVGNDLSVILDRADIRGIFCNGKIAGELYARLCQPSTGRAAIVLPSTSPANAAVGLAELSEGYRMVLDYIADI